jgi:hypothetical protein
LTGPRLATGIWIAAKLKLIRAKGDHATIIKKGDDTAGAVLIVLRLRSGDLRVATAQSDYQHQAFGQNDDVPDRHFAWRDGIFNEIELTELISRERRFDPDLWVVECECDQVTVEATFSIQ